MEANRSGGHEPPATVLSASPQVEPVVGTDAPVLEVMRAMRAMRRLKPDPVPRDLLEQLVEAATWAPSASNAQRYAYVVVTDRRQMRRLAPLWREAAETYLSLSRRVNATSRPRINARMIDAIRYQADHFEDTPALIAACYERSTLGRDAVRRPLTALWLLGRAAKRHGLATVPRLRRAAVLGEAASVYPAVQNMLLTARALGLGANLALWHLGNEDAFRRVLGAPPTVGLYALIPVGWPEGRFGPVRRRPAAEVMHWEHWA